LGLNENLQTKGRILDRSVKAGPFEKLGLLLRRGKGEIGKILVPDKISPQADLTASIDFPPIFDSLRLFRGLAVRQEEEMNRNKERE
jgi:hypothetical protein